MVNDAPQMCIGKQIRKYREQQQKSIEELAADARMSDKYLGDVERGEYSITANYLLKLHNAFGRPRYFFDEIHKCIDNNS